MSSRVRSQIIGEWQGVDATMEARRENREIEKEIQRRRKTRILPPENVNIILHQDLGALPGGLVLSVPHEVGRMLLHRHRHQCSIIEHDVTVDAVIEGGLEDAVEAMGLGAEW